MSAVNKSSTPTGSSKKNSTKKKAQGKKIRWSDVGGLASQIAQLQELTGLLKDGLLRDQVKTLGIRSPRGVLLYGSPGTGKTLLARAAISESEVRFSSVSPLDALTSQTSPPSRGAGDLDSDLPHLVQVFAEARDKAPCIIFIDDLETICPKYETGHMTVQESRAVRTLADLIDSLSDTDAPVLIIATCSRPDMIDRSLRKIGKFDKEIEIPVPSSSERREILTVMLRKIKHSLAPDHITSIADRLHGFVGADLAALCSEAGLCALRRFAATGKGVKAQNCLGLPQQSVENGWSDENGSDGKAKQTEAGTGLTAKVSSMSLEDAVDIKDRENLWEAADMFVSCEDFQKALPLVKPSALRELQVEVPTVRWQDIGGQEVTKCKFRESVEWPLKHPAKFLHFGIRPPRGILLFGPPGCSKTLMARALATESGLNFLAIKGPELYNKYVGESERTLREIFNRARISAPSIIFIDEIDALTSTRGGGAKSGNSVGDRILFTLLLEMDGIQCLEDVILVGATNRPQVIDPALMRPGRLDRIIYVPLPDAKTRRGILDIRFRKTPTADDVDQESLVNRTEGFSGAEITALCQEAALAALEEDFDIMTVHMRHFERALTAVKPRTTADTVKGYDDFYEKNALDSFG